LTSNDYKGLGTGRSNRPNQGQRRRHNDRLTSRRRGRPTPNRQARVENYGSSDPNPFAALSSEVD